jgi:hypothetical protein
MRDDYLLACLVHIRQQEAQAFVARERLADSLRLARQPRQLRFSSALRQLRAWCLRLQAVPSHRHGPVAPRGIHQGTGRW